MKSEAEIRKYLADLKTGDTNLCICNRCLVVRPCRKVTMDHLAWVLGDNDGLEQVVEQTASDAAHARLEGRQ